MKYFPWGLDYDEPTSADEIVKDEEKVNETKTEPYESVKTESIIEPKKQEIVKKLKTKNEYYHRWFDILNKKKY